MTPTALLLVPTHVIAQTTPQPTAPANPGMVGLPEGSQPLPAPGTTGQPNGPTPGAQSTGPFGGMQFLVIMVGVMGIMIVMQVLTGRKEKKRRQEMLTSMKRGDKVQTIGGIIGTIRDMSDDDMVLQLEEGRMRVIRSSVQGVIKESRGKSEDQTPEVVVKQGREKASV